MSSTIEPEKISEIFNLYTKYRFMTYNSIISSDSQIYKFKERLQNFYKIFGDMESKKYIQKDPDQIQILVKEGKDKKVYTESAQEKESQEEKTEDNSINTEITKNKENEENINTQIAKKFPGDK